MSRQRGPVVGIVIILLVGAGLHERDHGPNKHAPYLITWHVHGVCRAAGGSAGDREGQSCNHAVLL